MAGLSDGTDGGLEAGTIAAFQLRASGVKKDDFRSAYEVPELAAGTDAHYRHGYEAGYQDAFAVSYPTAYLQGLE